MRRHLAAGLVLAALFAAYAPSLGGGFLWDDDSHITDNLALRSPAGLWTVWFRPGLLPHARTSDAHIPTQYYPLLHTSFWIDYRLWGLAPAGYRVENVLLHFVVAVLAWAVLRRLGLPGAAWAAAAFALHPVHVESVAWITERKNLLSGALCLGAALAYLRFSPPEAEGPGTRRGPYLVSILLFTAALLAKTVSATLPVALAIVLWWRRGRISRGDLRALSPMVLLALGLAAVTVVIEWLIAGAGADWDLSFTQRCLVAARALWFYPAKLAWPSDQAFVYPRWEPDPGDPAQWGYVLAWPALLAAAWFLRRRVGRGPLAALLYFTVTISPALGFIDYYTMRFSFVADHYQYLASLGPIAAACAGACLLARRWPGRAPVLAGLGVLAVLGALTWSRAHVFRSTEALWRDTLAKNPSCLIALNNLGLELLERGRLGESVALLQEAVRLQPDYAPGHYNLALALERQGDLDGAIRHLTALIRGDERRHGQLHQAIGVLHARRGRLREAIAAYRRGLALFPRSPALHNSLAVALANDGRPGEAIEHYRQALRSDPGLVDARYNLGLLLAGAGRVEEARAELERARDLAASRKEDHLLPWIDSRLKALGQPGAAGPRAQPPVSRSQSPRARRIASRNSRKQPWPPAACVTMNA